MSAVSMGSVQGAQEVPGADEEAAAVASPPAPEAAVVRGSAPRIFAAAAPPPAPAAAPPRSVDAIRADMRDAGTRGDLAAFLRDVDEVALPLLGPDGGVATPADPAAMQRFLAVADPVEENVPLANWTTAELAAAADAAGPDALARYDAIFAAAPPLPPGSPIGIPSMDGGPTYLHEDRWQSAVAGHFQFTVRDDMNSAQPADRLRTIDRLLDAVAQPDWKPGEPVVRPDADPLAVSRAVGSITWMAGEGGFAPLVAAARAVPGEVDRLTALLDQNGGYAADDWFDAIGAADAADRRADPAIGAVLDAMKPLVDDGPPGEWKLAASPAPADVARFRAALAALPRDRLADLAFAADPVSAPNLDPDIDKLDAAVRALAPADVGAAWERAAAAHDLDRIEAALEHGRSSPAVKLVTRMYQRFTDDQSTLSSESLKVRAGASAADIGRFRAVFAGLRADGRLADIARVFKTSGSYSSAANPPTMQLTGLGQIIDDPRVGADGLRSAWLRAAAHVGI
jgi:hypothetical protein